MTIYELICILVIICRNLSEIERIKIIFKYFRVKLCVWTTISPIHK